MAVMDNNTFKGPKFEDHFGLLIEQISILMQRKTLNYLKEGGYEITFNELLMLILLTSNNEGLAQKEIAEKLFKDKSMITRFSNRLEKLRLVTKVKSKLDARLSRVSITKKGSRLVQSLDKIMIPFERSFIESISKPELLVFKSVLQKLLKHAASEND